MNTTATYSYYPPLGGWQGTVAIADFGSPIGSGGGTRNDGWNDIVYADEFYWLDILINTRQAPFFDPSPSQQVLSPVSSCTRLRQIKVGDIQNTGGTSLICSVNGGEDHGIFCAGGIYLNKHTGNPAPAPPKNVSVIATPPNQFGYRYPKVSWAPNTERDIASYDVWRRIVSATDCGNGVWYFLSTTGGSTWEYTDNSISTAGIGSQCTAEYKVLAKDVASNASDFSSVVSIQFSNLYFKRSDDNGGERIASKPTSYSVHAAYPNPFNPSTEIKFDLAEDSRVTLAVYDMLGRKVVELVNANYAAGYHSSTWNAAGMASGMYFARFTATDANGQLRLSKISKLILNK